MRLQLVAWVVCVALASACSRSAPPPPPAPPPVLAIEGLPFELTIAQRTQVSVPGTRGRLTLSIDDITRGRTRATLRADGRDALLDACSLRTHETAAFELDGQPFVLRLDALDNRLIGEDFARFSFRARDAASVDERARIDGLIASIGALEHAVFVRNGSEHTPAEAAEHLRRKLEAAGEDVGTADQFVEQLASRSSISGEPYAIRFDDGRTTTVADFLRAELARR